MTRAVKEQAEDPPARRAGWSHDWQPRWSHEAGRKPLSAVPCSWQATRPLSLFAPFALSCVTISVFYTWMYNGTGGNESRLIEEGVESMQNLCSASLVDLMLKTRLPIMRMVDWLDHAFLYLHLPKEKPEEPPPSLHRVRVLGIRTATDLERVWNQSDRSAELKLLLGGALIPNDPKQGRAVISSLLLSLGGEPNLWHVRAFRRLQWLGDEHCTNSQPAPGRGEEGE